MRALSHWWGHLLTASPSRRGVLRSGCQCLHPATLSASSEQSAKPVTTIVPISPPLWVTTPLGEGEATHMIDRGPDHHLQWVVWINNTGECWTLRNPEVRRVTNITMGRDSITPFGESSQSRFSFAGKDEYGDDRDA